MPTILKRSLGDGASRYKAIVRRKGSPTKTKTFRTRAQALAWATKLEAAILDQERVPSRQEELRTVSDLIREYKEAELPKKRAHTRRVYDRHLSWWDSVLGDKRLTDVRRKYVSDALRRLAAGKTISGSKASPTTCNRYLASFRQAWNVAVKRWEWVSENPCSGMMEREPRGRVRFLSQDELERLLTACRSSSERRLYPLVVMALSTGARQTELLSLRWSDVDFTREVAILEQSKNQERRALPLSESALTVLRALHPEEKASGPIFANSRGKAPYPRAAFLRAAVEAELQDFRFHDLRHTAASYLAMSGASLVELAAILGHKTLAMVKRYAHLTEQHSAEVVKRMDRVFLLGQTSLNEAPTP